MHVCLIVVLFFALTLFAAPQGNQAHAATSSPVDTSHPLGVASNFNAFVLNNMNMVSDSEGRIAVGNQADLNNYSVASQLPDDNAINMVIGKSLQYNGGQLNGQFVLGQGGTVSLSGGTTARQAKDTTIDQVPDFKDNGIADFTAAKAQLENYSQWYKSLSGVSYVNGTVTESSGQVTFSYDGDNPELVVFNLNASDFNQAGGGSNNFQINYAIPHSNDKTTVIVNVTGSNQIYLPGYSTQYKES
jgi:choice-of-anchor A domain-containing protein